MDTFEESAILLISLLLFSWFFLSIIEEGPVESPSLPSDYKRVQQSQKSNIRIICLPSPIGENCYIETKEFD